MGVARRLGPLHSPRVAQPAAARRCPRPQVVLDKNPNLRTVVNKLGSIESEYRVFAMEVLAGQACLQTEVKQHAARFQLDFSQVTSPAPPCAPRSVCSPWHARASHAPPPHTHLPAA